MASAGPLRGCLRRQVCTRLAVWPGQRQGATRLGFTTGTGETGEMLQGLSEDQVRRIGARTRDMWRQHVTLETRFPEASLPPEGLAGVDPDAVRRKRLVYRSKQRGWLEVDLLMGAWADEHVKKLTPHELDEYEDVINCETVDIFHLVTGPAPPPPPFDGNGVLLRLREYALSRPLGTASPEGYALAKRVRNLT